MPGVGPAGCTGADWCQLVPTVWPTGAPGDSDCDGWTDALELLIGTDPNVACDNGAGLPDWPPDFEDNKIVDIFDVSAMAPPRFFASSSSGPPWVNDPNPLLYTVRHDLTADGTIDIFDVSALAPPLFFATCP